jgi:hypothetical protein
MCARFLIESERLLQCGLPVVRQALGDQCFAQVSQSIGQQQPPRRAAHDGNRLPQDGGVAVEVAADL